MCNCKDKLKGNPRVKKSDKEPVVLGLKPQLVANHATAYKLERGGVLIVKKGEHNMIVQRRVQRDLMDSYPNHFQEQQLVPA